MNTIDTLQAARDGPSDSGPDDHMGHHERELLALLGPPAAWCGWWRPPGGRWQQLSEGNTEGETLDTLLDRMARERLAGALVILPQGQTPWKSGAKA